MAHASGADFLQTPYLFAPVGADFTLQTHDGLAAFVGATLLGALSPVTAVYVTTLASLASTASVPICSHGGSRGIAWRRVWRARSSPDRRFSRRT